MKRRHGINTSQNKHYQSNQQLQEVLDQQNLQTHDQQQSTSQMTVSTLMSNDSDGPSNFQVIQTESTTNGIAITPIQTFNETIHNMQTVMSSTSPIQTSFRNRQHELTTNSHFNGSNIQLSNFLPNSLSYNFYNVPNETDLIHPQ